MPHEIKITTNNVPRDIINAWELTAKEREEFGYLNWKAIEEGRDSAEFIRFKGELYDLGEFIRTAKDGEFAQWHGVRGDSFFSGLLIRYPLQDYSKTELDYERVIVGTYYC